MKTLDSGLIFVKGAVKLYERGSAGEVSLLSAYSNALTPLFQSVFMHALTGADRISKIYIGSGGDLDPITKVDTGARVAPSDVEVGVRRLLYEVPIVSTEVNLDLGVLVLRGSISPEAFTSSDINELGLVSDGGLLVSHWVAPADGFGLATKYVKTEHIWFDVEWTLHFQLRR